MCVCVREREKKEIYLGQERAKVILFEVMNVCVCQWVCMCVWEREREQERNLGKKRKCVGRIMSVRCGFEREWVNDCVCEREKKRKRDI